MKPLVSALYQGVVMHKRLRPRPHKLRYRVFSMLFDLDELPDLGRRFWLFSHNRFNLFSFYDRDHGDGKTTLRMHVEATLQKYGVDVRGGPIRLLCMPRMLGFVFNPLSVYFCHRQGGELAAILYEVTNTFGERHNYLIPVEETAPAKIEQQSEKRFHVSPFLPIEGLRYCFRIAAPTDSVSVAVHVHDRDGLIVAASLTGQKSPLTNGTLSKTFVLYPMLTLKVIAGIHWEALRLWLKGLRVHTKPEPPDRPVTLGSKGN